MEMINLKDWKNKWVKALRSGEYQQGRGKLRRGNQYGTKYCCLGVLEEISGIKSPSRSLLSELRDRGTQTIVSGLNIKDQNHLSQMNDKGLSFNQIANWIEKYL